MVYCNVVQQAVDRYDAVAALRVFNLVVSNPVLRLVVRELAGLTVSLRALLECGDSGRLRVVLAGAPRRLRISGLRVGYDFEIWAGGGHRSVHSRCVASGDTCFTLCTDRLCAVLASRCCMDEYVVEVGGVGGRAPLSVMAGVSVEVGGRVYELYTYLTRGACIVHGKPVGYVYSTDPAGLECGDWVDVELRACNTILVAVRGKDRDWYEMQGLVVVHGETVYPAVPLPGD